MGEDRDLADRMAVAAKAATDACVAKGLSRSDPITVHSAKRAAQEVYEASGRAYEPSVRRLVDEPHRADLD